MANRVWTYGRHRIFVSGLFHFWIQPRIGRQLVRRGKAGDVPDLTEDDGAQHRANTGDGSEGGVKLGEQFRNSFLQYGGRILEELELAQVHQEQCGVSALAARDAETVPGKLLELSGLPLSKAPVAGRLEYLGQLSGLRPGQLLRRGILA